MKMSADKSVKQL